MTEITYQSKYIRVSPKKLRLFVQLAKGLSPRTAMDQLKFYPKKAVGPLLVAIKSALANATNNLKLNPDNLRIKTIAVNEGQSFKRWRAVARGTAHPYKKRTSHIKVVLEEVVRGSESKS